MEPQEVFCYDKKEEKCNRKRSRNYLGYLLET